MGSTLFEGYTPARLRKYSGLTQAERSEYGAQAQDIFRKLSGGAALGQTARGAGMIDPFAFAQGQLPAHEAAQKVITMRDQADERRRYEQMLEELQKRAARAGENAQIWGGVGAIGGAILGSFGGPGGATLGAKLGGGMGTMIGGAIS